MASILDRAKRFLRLSNVQSNEACEFNDRGIGLAERGILDDAIVHFYKATRLDPTVPVFWSNLGNALMGVGDYEQACLRFETGAAITGAPPELFDNWGTALVNLGRLMEAAAAHKKAIAADPSFSPALANLGNTYREMGFVSDAMMNLDAACQLSPGDRIAASARLYTMNHLSSLLVEDVAQAHKSWPAPMPLQMAPFTNKADPTKKIRVGYVSADFRIHSCAHFLLPLIEAHDRKQVHVTAFNNSSKGDEVTEAFMRAADEWVNIAALSDQETVAHVRARCIDILIDCSGHTTGNRLSAFAMRAAPIQVSWLGYPNTTGLRQMDARLTDRVASPDGFEDLFVEELIYLESGFHSFQLLRDCSPVGSAPSESQGKCTFGAFHNLAKLSDETLMLWGAVLEAVPQSTLKIKSKSFLDKGVLAEIRQRCTRLDLEGNRVTLVPWRAESGAHLLDLNDIDVFLDAHPYNGTTSVCEALWMGVPVVTLPTPRPAGRVCASLLTQAGFPEWIAETEEHFVEIAAGLASDPGQLTHLRQTMRQRVQQTSLGDGQKFAKSVESAYRRLWKTWCEQAAL